MVIKRSFSSDIISKTLAYLHQVKLSPRLLPLHQLFNSSNSLGGDMLVLQIILLNKISRMKLRNLWFYFIFQKLILSQYYFGSHFPVYIRVTCSQIDLEWAIWHSVKVTIQNCLNNKVEGSNCNNSKIQGVQVHFTNNK